MIRFLGELNQIITPGSKQKKKKKTSKKSDDIQQMEFIFTKNHLRDIFRLMIRFFPPIYKKDKTRTNQ